jgi:hypothetical protein
MSTVMLLSSEGVPIVRISVREAPDTALLADARAIVIEAREQMQDVLVVTTTELTLVVPREIAGTGINLAASVPATTWFAGFNSTVAMVNWRDRRVRASVDVLGPVLSLHMVGADEVLAVHEIGACRLDGEGRTLWSYGSGLITAHAIWDGQLRLRCDDGTSAVIDLATGRVVEEVRPSSEQTGS